MKTNKYIVPQIEVIEIEVEDAILATSDDVTGVNIDDLLDGDGRY